MRYLIFLISLFASVFLMSFIARRKWIQDKKEITYIEMIIINTVVFLISQFLSLFAFFMLFIFFGYTFGVITWEIATFYLGLSAGIFYILGAVTYEKLYSAAPNKGLRVMLLEECVISVLATVWLYFVILSTIK